MDDPRDVWKTINDLATLLPAGRKADRAEVGVDTFASLAKYIMFPTFIDRDGRGGIRLMLEGANSGLPFGDVVVFPNAKLDEAIIVYDDAGEAWPDR